MTDVNVQFFSHLNGLNLGNNWGDLIRLLDICLVNGKPLPSIILQTVDPESGDITLEFSANHSCMLLQIVELNGFSPSSVNTKYRVKGVPNDTTLILKADNKDLIITSVGTSKLSPLGYDIVFRDEADVKRVYRSKNTTDNHPFIRVDESLTSSEGSWTTTYSKYAMVALLDNMTHIDDISGFQLPNQPTLNWSIKGTGTNCIRGYSRWYWVRSLDINSSGGNGDAATPATGNRVFSLVGNNDCFYFIRNLIYNSRYKAISGCGLYDTALSTNIIKNWFLMTSCTNTKANSGNNYLEYTYSSPFGLNNNLTAEALCTIDFNELNEIRAEASSYLLLPDKLSGSSGLYSANNVSALEIPIYDTKKYLRGILPIIHYSGNKRSDYIPTPIVNENSMYLSDSLMCNYSTGGVYFYLGELV